MALCLGDFESAHGTRRLRAAEDSLAKLALSFA
jgi:hypothetical protein